MTGALASRACQPPARGLRVLWGIGTGRTLLHTCAMPLAARGDHPMAALHVVVASCHFAYIVCFWVPTELSQPVSAHPSQPPHQSFESLSRSGCHCGARAVGVVTTSAAVIVTTNHVRMWLHGVARRLLVCRGGKVSDSWSWAEWYEALVGGGGARCGRGHVSELPPCAVSDVASRGVHVPDHTTTKQCIEAAQAGVVGPLGVCSL